MAERRQNEARLWEALDATNDCLCEALEAIQAFVRGDGPRGMELLSIITKAAAAADLRDAVEREVERV